jgi:hypothetical protein
MIPKVRPWLVRFIRDGATVAEIRVETVNRRFARWLALEQYPAGALIGTRCTVSRMATECQAAAPACNPASYSRMS